MRTNYIKRILFTGVLAASVVSCNDLDLEPRYEISSASAYQNFENYKPLLAKMYAGFAVTGQTGPAGQPDVLGFDEGKSNYVRAYWQLQELPTEEAVAAWNDGTLGDLHDMDWTTGDEYVRFMYDRIFYQVSLTNEFIRGTTPEKVDALGVNAQETEQIKQYRAEARFLRALSYWHALDLFGNVPFVTEDDPVGSFFPEQTTRAELFNYVESELLAIENDLVNAGENEYGRADKGAAWTLLTKLYLNAEVYTGEPKFTEAITYAKNVVNAGYTLEPEYEHLFLADNHTGNGIIFPITFDGLRTKTWGGTTFLVHAAVGGKMNPEEFGINGGWGGIRTTEAFVNLFPDVTGETDGRALFHTEGQSAEIENIFSFTDGIAVTKYKNVTAAGNKGSDPTGNHPDTDFPMFRLADVYLMYAEAVLRGGQGGDLATALSYVNSIRERAYGDNSGDITAAELTLDFIIDERGRELYWEGHRRTDLIRFGRFTSDAYLWPWKGGVKEGRGVEPWRVLYPITSFDLTANPGLEQNEGY